MSETNTKDEPAFPIIDRVLKHGAGSEVCHSSSGISKIDFFAAHALPAVILQYDMETWEDDARVAYEIGAAMLAESQRRAGK